MDSVQNVAFCASFPNIQCIKYLGDGGARIVLDIPQSDEGAIETLRQWRGMVLMVVVTPVKDARTETDDGQTDTDRNGQRLYI
jgi:hypothetical protein